MTITLSLVAPEPFVVLNLNSVFSLLWFTNLAPTEALSPPSLRKYKAALLLSVVPVFPIDMPGQFPTPTAVYKSPAELLVPCTCNND